MHDRSHAQARARYVQASAGHTGTNRTHKHGQGPREGLGFAPAVTYLLQRCLDLVWCGVDESALDLAGCESARLYTCRAPPSPCVVQEVCWLADGAPTSCPSLIAGPRCPWPKTTITHEKWSKMVLRPYEYTSACSETCFFDATRVG